MTERPHYYKLIGKLIVPTDMFGAMVAHRVAETTVGELWVSTVFLGIDHALFAELDDPPVIFETMIFNRDEADYQTRCCTYDEAEVMHAKGVAVAKEWIRKAARASAKITLPIKPEAKNEDD